MAPTGDAYHVDWVWSNNSNVHVANHRDWFTTFTPIKSTVYSGLIPEPETGSEVLGIGNVELNVKTKAYRTGRGTHRTIVLKDVLYVPKYISNILGRPIIAEYDVITEKQVTVLKDKRTGGTAGLFDLVKLWKLWLVGHRKGDTSLDPNGMYWIIAQWPDDERKRWLLHRNAGETSDVGQRRSKGTKHGQQKVSDYTTEEKQWLKRMYGGEWKFLRDYGLKIEKDDDREEGRRIARTLMQEDTDNDDEDEDEEEENQFLADLEADPSSHFADHYFSEEQLDWIQKHYRHSGNFLIIHGLKFYDDDDCKEGVAIAEAFMSDDGAH